MLLGAHMSIAGGYYRAIEGAVEEGCDCVQLFTKNNNQWAAKDLTDEDVCRFKEAADKHRQTVRHTLSHASYLINLAAPDKELWEKSIDAFVIELQRAELLGIPYVVLHPGAYTTSSEKRGIRRIIWALDRVHKRLPECTSQCLLETTAGQGTSLGCRFEHLAQVMDGIKAPERVGVCIDSCHIFAAGYPLGTEEEYTATMSQFESLVGFERLQAFHLNDSKKELGSRVDRHENIGEGFLGLEPFRFLMNDSRFEHVPMYIETPKKERDGVSGDVWNLSRLRGLIE